MMKSSKFYCTYTTLYIDHFVHGRAVYVLIYMYVFIYMYISMYTYMCIFICMYHIYNYGEGGDRLKRGLCILSSSSAEKRNKNFKFLLLHFKITLLFLLDYYYHY